MFNMHNNELHTAYCTSDASFAPAACAARCNALSLRNDTAMLVVSFLHIIVAVICGLVRIITPTGAKPEYFISLQ